MLHNSQKYISELEFKVYIQGLMKGKCKTMTEKFNNDYFNRTTYIVRLF